MRRAFLVATLTLTVAACTPRHTLREVGPVIDPDLAGVWSVKHMELAGKPMPVPAGFELRIEGNQYRAGIPPHNDRGRIVLFGDEVAGEARRMDVLGEGGPNAGKRYPAIYRFVGRDLEVCYDLSEKERPATFATREGTRLMRALYTRKAGS